MTTALRHYCRNPHCRSKLKAPVENHHQAFCTRGCFNSFYLTRCRVCEKPLRKTATRGAPRVYCRPPNKCGAEARRWPHVYEYGPSPAILKKSLESADKTGLETGTPPRPTSLKHWRWKPEDDLELELHDRAGKLLARLEHNRGRYRLTYPRTTPILSWPDIDLAKHGAESIALGNLGAAEPHHADAR